MTAERENAELSEFLLYLARENGDGGRLPSLAVLSQQLGISIASLREQLEVARAFGLVEVRPKTGIRRLRYQFSPAVFKSLTYANAIDSSFFFNAFSDLRTHIEAAYWQQAVSLLNDEDIDHLESLVDQALEKINGNPIHIPHDEHRELHLCIYRRLNNPFVTGILEAYWESYEAFGLNLYTDISYVKKVWDYHRRMVEAIRIGDLNTGYHLLIEHTSLLQERYRPRPRPVAPRQEFE